MTRATAEIDMSMLYDAVSIDAALCGTLWMLRIHDGKLECKLHGNNWNG